MSAVFNGRYTADIEGPFVVFLIGMRVNKVFSVRKWWPTAMAMGPMLRTLYSHPEKGFLGGQTFLTWRGIALVTYWRSHEDLDRFARNPSDPHLAAWKAFNKNVGPDGSVGIWHETYLVEANAYECVYGNMPRYGLAAAGDHVPAVGNRQTARLRLGQREDAVGVALTANRRI
jgi:hypothetical protein